MEKLGLMWAQLRTRWELVEDEVRVLVHANEVSRSELLMRNQADDGEENRLT
jgi:hypothetical protein